MLANAFVDNAKVMAKGQVTIPKDVREVLGVTSGDRISFIVEGGTVRIVNSAVYAMQMLQREMAGEAERVDLTSDDDVMTLVKELRNEDENTLVREDYDGYDGWIPDGIARFLGEEDQKQKIEKADSKSCSVAWKAVSYKQRGQKDPGIE